MMMHKPLGFILFLILFSTQLAAEQLCVEDVCIGDDVEALGSKWKPIKLTYYDEKFVETELAGRTAKDVYADFYEVLVADDSVLKTILPYVIRKQQFDSTVLRELSKVRAICSSLTLTGEVERESSSRLFVTFRVTADKGSRGKLRVVRLEKQFNIMSPHIRPRDAAMLNNVKKELKNIFPDMKVVRDIDGRHDSIEVQTASALLGFRFISDVSNPLILRVTDPAEIPAIEDDPEASPLCKTAS
ncbi:hypothetical protein [Pleionea sp. CnH1-48]|uniref:hypothetical protein n=1 Tax=Pleionea sp. CnH1-48 TaxID=2954494 RepID=UPI0020985C1D|nr:hypothetical protein [Pleionea sp. CnH1-48]MCO7226792.1 hypothetical protein [Pleionea sp. CnH1-48]